MNFPSIYFIYSKLYRKKANIGNFEYRSYIAMKYLKLALKSFVLGKMYVIII